MKWNTSLQASGSISVKNDDVTYLKKKVRLIHSIDVKELIVIKHLYSDNVMMSEKGKVI
jgi:hypothetical protein